MTSSETERFFTLHKLWWSTVYGLMLIGVLSTWVFVRVKVLEEAVAVGPMEAQAEAVE